MKARWKRVQSHRTYDPIIRMVFHDIKMCCTSLSFLISCHLFSPSIFWLFSLIFPSAAAPLKVNVGLPYPPGLVFQWDTCYIIRVCSTLWWKGALIHYCLFKHYHPSFPSLFILPLQAAPVCLLLWHFSRREKHLSIDLLNAPQIPEDIFEVFFKTFFHCAPVAAKDKLTDFFATIPLVHKIPVSFL